VSEISYQRIENVEDVLKEGDEIRVKLVEIDQKTGKYRLSAKAVNENDISEPSNRGGQGSGNRSGGSGGGGHRSGGGGGRRGGDRR